jgi:two-component system sensor histidine kinase CpxA
MPRLFWKIFFWFWLAMILVGSTLLISISTTRSASGERRMRLFVRALMLPQAQYMAQLFEQRGTTALSDYLQEVDPPAGVHSILYRANGVDVVGNPAPEYIRPWIIDAAQDAETHFEGDRANGAILQAATGPSGTRYVLYTEHKHGPPPPLMTMIRDEPGAQVFRLVSVILAGALVCFALAHYITSPVLRLQNASRRIAGGDLGARVHPDLGNRRDEIADLGRDFDVMAGRIEALIRSQHQLLQAISHEMRSPLARLSLAVTLAKGESGKQRSELLDRVEIETERIEAMLSQLLTLARLDSGETSFPRGPVELSLLVSAIVTDADFEASARNRFVILTDVECCLVDISESLLRSAIENVVRNAVRYTREFSNVEVSLTVDKSSPQAVAVIHVVDQGPGVPPEDLAQIFKPFYRVNSARERETGGTGLGLAITDRAVRLYSGVVSAKNVVTGGLDVEIRLPTFPPAPAGFPRRNDSPSVPSEKPGNG